MTNFPELHIRAMAVYNRLKDEPYEDAIRQIDEAEYVQECARTKIDALYNTKSTRPEYVKMHFVDGTIAVPIDKGVTK